MNDIPKWNEFYKIEGAPEYPSNFAQYCLPKISKDGILLDMGCGNGRDSIFFKQNGIVVIGMDNSNEAIIILTERNITCFPYDFTKLPRTWQPPMFGEIHTVYYRFSLHAVSHKAAVRSLFWTYEQLAEGGKVMIEVRSIKDDLFGMGNSIGKTGFVYGHYRRFVNKLELEHELETIGFNIVESKEGRGLAPHKDEDPVVVRVIGVKQ